MGDVGLPEAVPRDGVQQNFSQFRFCALLRATFKNCEDLEGAKRTNAKNQGKLPAMHRKSYEFHFASIIINTPVRLTLMKCMVANALQGIR